MAGGTNGKSSVFGRHGVKGLIAATWLPLYLIRAGARDRRRSILNRVRSGGEHGARAALPDPHTNGSTVPGAGG